MGLFASPYDMLMEEIDYEKYLDIRQRYRFEKTDDRILRCARHKNRKQSDDENNRKRDDRQPERRNGKHGEDQPSHNAEHPSHHLSYYLKGKHCNLKHKNHHYYHKQNTEKHMIISS